MNAGQTCVAPDYLLVEEGVGETFLEELANYATRFSKGDSYGRIVNEQHFERLQKLLKESTVYVGGESDREGLSIKPAIITDVDWDAPAMQEEIFGPVLPVLTFKDLDQAIDAVNRRPSPLAAYIFSRDKGSIANFKKRLRAGSMCINDTVTQLLPADLPFGGVGGSGHGRYHGRAGFDTFSNPKSILDRRLYPDPEMRYPPYSFGIEKLKRSYSWLMR